MASNEDTNSRLPRLGAKSTRRADVVPGALASLETTLPPTPLKKLLAADGASVYVLSVDQALLDAVHEAAGDQYPIHIVTEWSKLISVIRDGHCKIVLLDADMAITQFDKRIAELHELELSLVILLAAPRNTAQELIGMLSDRSVHRLLIKPAAVGITRLLLESALGRYLQLREQSHQSLEEEIENLRRHPPEAQRTRWPAWLLATALVSLLLGAVLVAGVMRLNSAGPSAPQSSVSETADVVPPANAGGPAAIEPNNASGQAATVTADSAAVSADDPLSAELARAAQALAEGRIAEPMGDSALDLYAAIVAGDPGHVEANQQLTVIIDTLFDQAESLLLDDALEEAAATIEHIRRVRPSTGRLAFLETQLTRARELEAQAAELAAAVAASEQAATPNEFESLLAIAATRLAQDRLVEPAGDSATAYLERALAIAPDDPRLLEMRSQLAAAVAARARIVLDNGDIEQVSVLADAAFRLGADSDTLTLLRIDLGNARELAAERARSDTFATGLQRLREGLLLAPENDSALYHLGVLRREQPNYPGLAAPWLELTETIAAEARAALAAQDFAAGESAIAALSDAGADATLVQGVREDLEAARRQAEYLSTAVPASELELLEFDLPEYPAGAVRSNTEGWVDLEFIVGADGAPRELVVVASEPQGRFEEAALAAVGTYRFMPYELSGRIYERLVRLRVRFLLQ